MTDIKGDFILQYPCHDGWDAQGFHDGGAVDFGWLAKYSKDGKTDIYASADGIVEDEGWYRQTYGGKTYNTIFVAIRHTDLKTDKDIITIYWHLSSTCVSKGDIVKRGQTIGKKGTTGNSNGVHLHFQCLALDKGQPIPDNTNGNGWAKYTFYPVPFLRVFPNQIFEYRGNFDLKKYDDPKESIKAQIIRLLEEL